MNRYQFYEHLKVYTASPPDVIRVDEKNLREHNLLNWCEVIITTNHKTDGILPGKRIFIDRQTLTIFRPSSHHIWNPKKPAQPYRART